jgi:glutamate-1-semialdehyde 2,1-aminomutase
MFEGCYHGHSDVVLASQSHQASAGVPEAVAQNTLVVPYNNLAALETCLKTHAKQIAAVIIEPIAGSMGVVPPTEGYLAGVRQLCTTHDTLLIFDEVLTGLRVGPGGAQNLYGIKPDLTCLGKALGGGMPIGAYGGAAEIMNALLPLGKVYQAGTFSGNPMTMAGGLETLHQLSKPGVYQTLEDRSAQLFAGLQQAINTLKAPVQLQRVGSLFGIIFAPHQVKNYQDSLSIDSRAFANFFHYLLSHGVNLPPSAVDAACVSAAHSQDDIETTIKICSEALRSLYQ